MEKHGYANPSMDIHNKIVVSNAINQWAISAQSEVILLFKVIRRIECCLIIFNFCPIIDPICLDGYQSISLIPEMKENISPWPCH